MARMGWAWAFSAEKPVLLAEGGGVRAGNSRSTALEELQTVKRPPHRAHMEGVLEARPVAARASSTR